MGAQDGSEQSEINRFRAVVHGHVQGVSFRYYTRQKATSLRLVGYVRNLYDGTVKVVAEGRQDSLQRFLSWLRVGPPLAHVTHVDVHWQPPGGKHRRFEVRF